MVYHWSCWQTTPVNGNEEAAKIVLSICSLLVNVTISKWSHVLTCIFQALLLFPNFLCRFLWPKIPTCSNGFVFLFIFTCTKAFCDFFFLHSYFILSVQTACADGVVRVFKLDDASSKSFKYVNFKSLLAHAYKVNVNHISCA